LEVPGIAAGKIIEPQGKKREAKKREDRKMRS